MSYKLESMFVCYRLHIDGSIPFSFFFSFQRSYDRVRGVEIGNKDIKLEYLEEAFTTSNWIVRIYKVKPPKNRSWGIFASEVVRAITSRQVHYCQKSEWLQETAGWLLLAPALARLTIVAIASVQLKSLEHLSPHLTIVSFRTTNCDNSEYFLIVKHVMTELWKFL